MTLKLRSAWQSDGLLNSLFRFFAYWIDVQGLVGYPGNLAPFQLVAILVWQAAVLSNDKEVAVPSSSERL